MNKYRYLNGKRLEEVLKSYGESDELSNASLAVLENMVSSLSLYTTITDHDKLFFYIYSIGF